MDTSHSATNQQSTSTKKGGMYVTTDGILRYCVIAPLLELPHDFQEWYRSNIHNHYSNQHSPA